MSFVLFFKVLLLIYGFDFRFSVVIFLVLRSLGLLMMFLDLKGGYFFVSISVEGCWHLDFKSGSFTRLCFLLVFI